MIEGLQGRSLFENIAREREAITKRIEIEDEMQESKLKF
jgi:hypothetical protein